MKDLVYNGSRWDNVNDGLGMLVEVLDQPLMVLGVFSDREAVVHRAELVAGLQLSCSKAVGDAIADAVESDLLGAGLDVLEAIHQQVAPGVHRIGGVGCRQLEFLQLRCQGLQIKEERSFRNQQWMNQDYGRRGFSWKKKLTGNPGIGLGQSCPGSVGLLLRGGKGSLHGAHVELHLPQPAGGVGVELPRLVLLTEKTTSVITIVRVGGVGGRCRRRVRIPGDTWPGSCIPKRTGVGGGPVDQ